MSTDRVTNAPRLRRLAEELADSGFDLDGDDPWRDLVLGEVDYALRPNVHERRIPTFGSIVHPTTDRRGWEPGTELTITEHDFGDMPLIGARRFADGLSSWLVLTVDARVELAVFDRPAGSERDLVVLSDVLGATIVQRHPSGQVRIAGTFGVLRWDGLTWHREPPIAAWVDSVAACPEHGNRRVIEILLEFAVHDLGSRGIGAILVYRPDDKTEPAFESRLPAPPALHVQHPTDLAPFRHALGQVDGAAVLDGDGVLRQLGVRLVPSLDAEASVAGLRGMRHTAGRRYSYDDPRATVIVVSDDGPVTVLRGGEVIGRSPTSLS
jgi:hypothetical protein